MLIYVAIFQLLEHAFPTRISHLNSIQCIEDTRCHNEKLPSTEEIKRLGNTHKRLLRLILPFSTHSKTFFFVITPLYVEPSNFFGSSNSLASKSFNKFLEAWRSSIFNLANSIFSSICLLARNITFLPLYFFLATNAYFGDNNLCWYKAHSIVQISQIVSR